MQRLTATKCFACADKRQIFQVHPPRGKVTLHEINDLLICTSRISNYEHKKEIFYAHGIDYDRVEQYHDNVCKLEKAWNLQQQQQQQPWYVKLVILIMLLIYI